MASPTLPGAPLGTRAGDTARINELLSGPGCAVIGGGVDTSPLASLREEIERQYAALEAAVAVSGVDEAGRLLPEGMRYQASAAGLGLDGFAGWEAAARALDGGVVEAIEAWFEGQAAVVRDLTWVRRQYPPALRAAGQAPHALHQDGAFGYSFSGGCGGGREDVLDMLTAWVPLCAAGVDRPGLEFRLDSPHRLLSVAELAARSAEGEGFAPAFEPGDVVVMAGHHVHRTHVTREMTRPRTCVELRFVGEREASPRLPGPRLRLTDLRAI
jgi:hypothetical protein